MSVEITETMARLVITIDVAVDPNKEAALNVAADMFGPLQGYYGGVPIDFINAEWDVP